MAGIKSQDNDVGESGNQSDRSGNGYVIMKTISYDHLKKRTLCLAWTNERLLSDVFIDESNELTLKEFIDHENISDHDKLFVLLDPDLIDKEVLEKMLLFVVLFVKENSTELESYVNQKIKHMNKMDNKYENSYYWCCNLCESLCKGSLDLAFKLIKDHINVIS